MRYLDRGVKAEYIESWNTDDV